MVYRNIIKYRIKRFHVWYNQKVDKYQHVNLIVDMKPYDSKKVHKMRKRANDHLVNDFSFFVSILIFIVSIIIVYAIAFN